MLVALCLMIGVSNIPAYSATVIGTAKTSDGYALQKTYITPVQAVKKAVKSSAKSTAKPTATKKTTISTAVKNLANQSISEINKLLKQKGLSTLAKKWLTKAKTLINNVKNGNKNNSEKKSLLTKALASIKKIVKAKASDLSLAQQTYPSSSVFVSLKYVLKNNIIYKTYAKYGTKGVTIVKKLAKNIGVKIKTVYNQFVRYGVTKLQLEKVWLFSKQDSSTKVYTSSFLQDLNLKGRFDNCGSLALAKYLNISRKMATLEHVAADLSLDTHDGIGFGVDGLSKVININGKKTGVYECKASYVMSELKKGEKAILCVAMLGETVPEHVVTIQKEKNGSYGVFDINVNNGNKVIYTEANFKKLISGKKGYVSGKTTNGKKITTDIYYKATEYVVTDSKNITEKNIETNFIDLFPRTYLDVKYMLSEFRSLVNNLLKKEEVSELAKTWLKAVYSEFDKYKNTDKYKDVFDEICVDLERVNESLKVISSEKGSILSIVKESSNYYFTPFNKILENNITYKIYTKYGETGLNTIKKYSEQYNLSQEEIYNQFVTMGISGDIRLTENYYKIKNYFDSLNK